MSHPSQNLSSAGTKVAEITVGGPEQEVAWPGRAPLLEAIQHWDPRLWQRLDDVITPPGTRGKSPVPLVPSSGVPVPIQDRPEWLEAVALIKQSTKSSGGYILQVLGIGEPSKEPEIASDGWIDTILSKEVCFENSKILKNKRVFGAWVSPRPQQPAKVPEQQNRKVDKGGRPNKFSWEEFWVEACRTAHTPDGLPEEKREFNKYMLEWVSQTWPDPPAESTVRAKVAKLYKRLSLP